MATDAPYRGARSRAPENPSGTVPLKNIIDELTAALRNIQVKADAIDAMVLGIEMMIENQRRLMVDHNPGSLVLGNELWRGIATLLTMVRHHAMDIGSDGQAAEIASMQANRAVAA